MAQIELTLKIRIMKEQAIRFVYIGTFIIGLHVYGLDNMFFRCNRIKGEEYQLFQ